MAAAGTRGRPGRTAARAPPTRAPAGSRAARSRTPCHKGRPTVRLPLARRGAGRAATPRAAVAGAAGRVATLSSRAGVGKGGPATASRPAAASATYSRRAAAWRRAAASATRRRAAAAASAPAAASARETSPLARVAPAPASRRARLVLCRPLFSRPWARGPRSARRRSARSAARPCRRGSPWARRSASSGSGRAAAPSPASRWRRAAAAAAFLCVSGRAR